MNNEIPNLELLNSPSGDGKRPKFAMMPEGWYRGLITSHSSGTSKVKKTPYIEYTPSILGPTEEIDPASLQGVDLKGKTFTGPSNRGGTFYVTEDAIWRLDNFHKSLGFDLDGVSRMDLVAQAVGKEVLVLVKHVPSKTRMDDDGNPAVFATVEEMKGA